LEKGGLEKLELLHPGWMGNIDEENSVPNGMGLRMCRHRLAHNFVPCSQYGMGFQRDIDFQRLYGLLKNGADGLRLLHGLSRRRSEIRISGEASVSDQSETNSKSKF
jgi:hypothetical protein